jgi:hypothetical protein
MAEKTITLVNGTKLTFNLNRSVFGGNGDAWEGTHQKTTIIRKTNITIVSGLSGKTITCDSLGEYKGAIVNLNAYNETDKCRGPVKVEGITMDEIRAVWGELEALEMETNPEMAAEKAKKEAVKHKKDMSNDIASANKIMIAVKAGLIFETDADEKKWRKNYSDLHNEGEGGYIPETTTKARAAWAETVLK